MNIRLHKERAPLYERMVERQRECRSSFHVPGHKHGKGLDPQGYDSFSTIMQLDFTELPGLDDLNQPSGIIMEAQQLAADCFGAEETFFLVNGSTVGNLAMILAVCVQDDILIVQRNVHKSIIHGLMLAGARAVFLPPCLDMDSSLFTGVRLMDIISAMDAYPEAKGVLLCNPNYYGMGIELAEVAEAVHKHGMPLLIDEAHGAHYGFHPQLPKSAISSGADVVVQSTHKMLTAMTMGAMLHVQGERINRQALRQRLTMLQSSSPSYPIMASLDLSRRWMHTEGSKSIDKALQGIYYLHKMLKTHIPAIGIMKKQINTTSYATLDPFKITIYDRSGTWNGFELKQKLEQAGCDAEMADPIYVLLQLSLATDDADINRLLDVLLDIFKPISLEKQDFAVEITNNNNMPGFLQTSLPITMKLPHFSDDVKVKAISLQHAVGLRAAEMVIPYPPGIPVLYYGEVITQQAVTYLQYLARQGASFQGTNDASLTDISVFIE
ncbi:MAG: lysine decarboxylase-like protein [Bacilli bacterium]|nr:lysine decarboxylase-like protein [Bacilli bacterium]